VKLYLYGIIDSGDTIRDVIRGLKGSSVCNVPYCDIGAAVSEMNGSIQTATEGDILQHEEVVERLMADFTVLPMRFLSIADGIEDVISIMQSCYKDFRDNLDRLRDKREFGIKVLWPADKIRQDIIKALEEAGQKTKESCTSANKKYVMERFKQYKIDKAFEAKADKLIRAIDKILCRFAAEKKLQKLKTANLLLDAVYLVEKSRQNSFREAFSHIKDANAELKFLFSGPWPAYNFVVLSGRLGLPGEYEHAAFIDGAAGAEILAGADSL
jgi:hypothetical protein